jgi:hypothetical protein
MGSETQRHRGAQREGPRMRGKIESVRRIHTPFRRAGRGSMAESRFGLRIPIAVAETRPSVVRGALARRGWDSDARKDDRLIRSVAVSAIRQIAGGDLTPQPTGIARRYGRARWQCPGFAIRPCVALTQRLRVHLQTDDRRRAARRRASGSAGVKAAACSDRQPDDCSQLTAHATPAPT